MKQVRKIAVSAKILAPSLLSCKVGFDLTIAGKEMIQYEREQSDEQAGAWAMSGDDVEQSVETAGQEVQRC